jgi:hypothetical protein
MSDQRDKHESIDETVKDEDVEAHKHLSANSEPSDEDEDVVAHKHLSASSEPSDDDDVDAHMHRAP